MNVIEFVADASTHIEKGATPEEEVPFEKRYETVTGTPEPDWLNENWNCSTLLNVHVVVPPGATLKLDGVPVLQDMLPDTQCAGRDSEMEYALSGSMLVKVWRN